MQTSERQKQMALSGAITATGIGLLLFCRFDALSHGSYSGKLLALGSGLLGWGLISVVLNWRDPGTSKRLIERLANRKAGVGETVGLLFVVIAALLGIDGLFHLWVDQDFKACVSSAACAKVRPG